jgi:hypothetical protein
MNGNDARIASRGAPRRRSLLVGLAIGIAVATVLAASGAAAPAPDRSLAVTMPVRDLALTGRSVAWVQAPIVRYEAEGSRGTCGRVGLWAPAAGQRWIFSPKIEPTCYDAASTGQGVWDVSVATRRLVWIEYMGGNFRDWWLVTATTTKRAPQVLAHVIREVEAKPPLVLGPGTPAGVPYALDDTVVYLGEKGTRIFTRVLPSPVRGIAAGVGPGRLRVAALLEDGSIVGLDARGRIVQTIRAQGVVSAIRVSSLGIAVQRGRIERGLVVPYPKVRIGTRAIGLPAGARMVDVAQGVILWTRAGDLGATSIRTGRRTVLADGSGTAPYFGQLEENGLAWAKQRVLRWHAGSVVGT